MLQRHLSCLFFHTGLGRAFRLADWLGSGSAQFFQTCLCIHTQRSVKFHERNRITDFLLVWIASKSHGSAPFHSVQNIFRYYWNLKLFSILVCIVYLSVELLRQRYYVISGISNCFICLANNLDRLNNLNVFVRTTASQLLLVKI